MAHYNEMNDPMEGYFMYEPSISGSAYNVSEGKKRQLICCLSIDYKNTLLWSHYADSHQGCCIEVEVVSKLTPYKVNYSNKIPVINTKDDEVIPILTHKSKYWEYESEVRFIKDERTPKGNLASRYIKVKINRIFLGCRMPASEVRFYKSLVGSILGSDIEVRQIKRNEIDAGMR